MEQIQQTPRRWKKNYQALHIWINLSPPPFLGGGGGHNEMMDHSTKVAIAWFLSQTHKSTFHHLWLFSKGTLGLFQTLLECLSTVWNNSPSAPHSAVRVQIWHQTMHVQAALNWHKWNSQKRKQHYGKWFFCFPGRIPIFNLCFHLFAFWRRSQVFEHLQDKLHYFWTWKTIQTLCFSQCLLTKSYFQNCESCWSIFPQLKAKYDADMLFFKCVVFYIHQIYKWEKVLVTMQY